MTPAAGIARRLAAMLYESLLVAAVLFVAWFLPYVLIGIAWNAAADGATAWLHLFLVAGCYFVFFWSRGGQTLAMKTWRIRVVNGMSGGPVSAARAALRYVLAWPSLFVFGLGILWALFDSDGQFLHDRLAGTRLVLSPPPDKR